jgi:hypothetical protein
MQVADLEKYASQVAAASLVYPYRPVESVKHLDRQSYSDVKVGLTSRNRHPF